MGTRADFYVGRGAQAEWLGSTAYDGYPDSFEEIGASATEKKYRERVAEMLAEDESATLPAEGWPWPWEAPPEPDGIPPPSDSDAPADQPF